LKVVVVVLLLLLLLSFNVFVPTSANSLLIYGQMIYPNIFKCQFTEECGSREGNKLFMQSTTMLSQWIWNGEREVYLE
jgi:hypothetical protein